MIKNIKIGNKLIGNGQPVFIIAEAGVNHNGKLDLALRLVDEAAEAGADAVKFQTFKAKQVVTEEGEMSEYQKKNMRKTESQIKMLKNLELRDEFYKRIIDHCRKRRIMFLSTPHGGFASVDFLRKLDVAAFKFGSGDLTNLPVLQYAAKFKKPIILGTGMSTMAEVKEAVTSIKKAGNHKIIVLHCTSTYPCQDEEVNLSAMLKMKKEADVLVGYSDHTLSAQVPVMAATLGACVLEKHFTLDRNLPGPDHLASVEPNELKEIIAKVKKVKVILGSGVKQPCKRELPHLIIGRKSIVAEKNIKKGQTITAEMLAIKRPGTGIWPKHLKKIVGRRAKKNILNDSIITWKMLS